MLVPDRLLIDSRNGKLGSKQISLMGSLQLLNTHCGTLLASQSLDGKGVDRLEQGSRRNSPLAGWTPCALMIHGL